MKRIALFLLTNIAVMLVLSAVCMLLGVDRYLTANGIDFGALLVASAVFGFGGSFISLLMSKTMAKMSTRAQVIKQPGNETEAWLLSTVERLARTANIEMPEVAIYEGEPNAFATGARKNAALVAVSTGLLQTMNKSEVEAVLGHEIAHVANGDMVTLTLIQGVVNTFVFFLARVIGYFIDRVVLKNEEGEGLGYFAVVMVAQIVLGILATVIVAWFSRKREFRADAGSAQYNGTQPMINALKRLGGVSNEHNSLPQGLNAFGITGGKLSALFASHPPIEERIKALESGNGRQ